MFQPAYLTRQFLAGKRKSFLNPIQMYVFCSFIFFLTASLVADDKIDWSGKEVTRGSKDSFSVNFDEADSLNLEDKETSAIKKPLLKYEKDINSKNNFSLNFNVDAKNLHEYDSMQTALPTDRRNGAIKSWITRKGLKIEDKYKNNGKSLLNSMTEKFQENLPNLVFVLLPFFALLLKFLYVRRRFFYVEHLLFSVHIHCFVFVTATFVLLLDEMHLLSETMSTVIFGIIFGYIFLAMKRMYEQSWLRTFAKFVVFGMLYGILLVFGVVLNLIATIALLDA